jgi:hypothetical protein
MKICFATEVTYPNYVNRIKKSSLKNFLDKKLNELGIYYYISTNLPNNFEEYYENNNIKIFDIDFLRRDNLESKKYELFPEDPTGLYPSKYPWNSRRFIIEQAAKDGFNYIIYIDADTVFRPGINQIEFFTQIASKFEPNTVKTNSTIFKYSNRAPEDVFNYHDKYISHFGLNFKDDEYDTIDGPCQVFMGQTHEDILRFIYNWNEFTIFGYKKEFGYGYGNNKHGNLSFVIPLSNFKLKWENYPFYPNHVVEDRYTHANNNSVQIKHSQNFTDNSIKVVKKTENKLSEIYKNYSCIKSSNGFSQIFEDFLNSISNNNSNILEIGVGTVSLDPPFGRYHVPENMHSWKLENPGYNPGNSLRAIRDFLQTGNIFGIDIQPDCLINEERIKTFIFDSRSPIKSHEFIGSKTFDLIIDDSDRDPNIRIITFHNFYNSLSDNGFYVFENILGVDFLEEYFSHNKIPYIVIDNFMIFNKKNNFNLINDLRNKIVNQPHFEHKKNEVIKDYSEIIKSTPKFSIDGNILADKGFYINLERSTDRKENVDRLINEFNIDGLLRFEALTDEMIQFACTKSHLQVFQTCLDNNINCVFVAEDDFNISETLNIPNSHPINFKNKIKLIKSDLDELEWDVFLFGCNPKSHLIPLTDNVAIVNKSTGAWAYLIKKRAFTYLLDNLNYKKDYIAIDDYLPILNEKGFTTLTSIPLTIGHAVGYESTLQPRGPVNYTDWINGNYYKFLYESYPTLEFTENKVEKFITIVVIGHFMDNFLFYLRYLLHSLPTEIEKCRFIIHYDEGESNDINFDIFKLKAFFRDEKSDLNVTITTSFGGLISSLNNVINNIKTKYFILLEHDWVFLQKDRINFKKLLNSFEKNEFVNAVWFNKDDNSVRGFEICRDIQNNDIPFGPENRISETDLIVTCRWSNNPSMFRTSKFKFWFDNYIKNEYIGKTNQSSHNVEETMIPIYRDIISKNNWYDVRDEWGTYLYGKLGDDAYVGHTDASKRYQGHNKSQPEVNGEMYIKNNPL